MNAAPASAGGGASTSLAPGAAPRPQDGRATPGTGDAADPAADAALAAALLAVDPAGLGGVRLRAAAGPARDAWLALLQQLLPLGTPMRRMPATIGDERLLGGLDLGATLQARRPVQQPGLLQQAAGGVLLLAMAERLPAATAGRVAAALDAVAPGQPALAVVALDEGEADEAPPASLCERLALQLDLRPGPGRWGQAEAGQLLTCLDRYRRERSVGTAQLADPAARLAAARAALPALPFDEDIATALCAAAVALGIASVRVPWLAWRAACAAAAWAGHAQVQAEDAELAARLVLGPRARQLPAGQADDAAQAAVPESAPPAHPTDEPPPPPETAQAATPPTEAGEAPAPPTDDAACAPEPRHPLPDRLTAAALSALPPGLLLGLAARAGQRHASAATGRAGAAQQHRRQGRPIGSVRGDPRQGRLDIIETLRAAAPWQPLRRREALLHGGPVGAQVLVRREDFRVRRFAQRRETTTVFAVDASGSLALHRLAEAKGAVELLLADCYVRRDKVALIAFRGTGAQLLLPPTRSLVRAKRCLAELPGGGGTPLAAGIDAARLLAEGLQRQGGSVLVVLMTDARANVGRGGAPGRERAAADALASARALRAAGLASLMIDTGRDPQPAARVLAEALGARYLPLPQADAGRLWQALQAPARPPV